MTIQVLFKSFRNIWLTIFFTSNIAYSEVVLEKYSNTDTYQLSVIGQIFDETADEFQKIIDDIKSTKKKLHLDMVHFNSRGGSFSASLEIGRAIRAERLNTFISSDAICHSACTIAFIGGIQRYAFGQFGVHSRTFVDGTEPNRKFIPSIVNKDIQIVHDYVREMRLSSNLANAILDTPSWTLRVLSNEEKFAWGVNGTDRPETDYLLLQIAKERGIKSGDYARVVDQHYRDCHQRTERLQETVWDCLRKREEEVPLWKRVRKWIREMLAE